MSETRFTPGPWRISRISGTTIESLTGRSVASAGGYSDNFSGGQDQLDNAANAHLIAAAPELYEALDEIWGWVENWGADFIFDPEFEDVPERIKTALRKARGEA